MLNENITYEELLSAYIELNEDLKLAKKIVTDKHIHSDAASTFIPFTNTVQAVKSFGYKDNDQYIGRLYRKYLKECEKKNKKPISKENFFKRTKEYYKKRVMSKTIAIGTDLASLKLSNELYKRNQNMLSLDTAAIGKFAGGSLSKLYSDTAFD